MAELEFPKELAEKIREGQKHGVSEENMVKGVVSLGNLLEKFTKPDTSEEALMKSMWDNATNEEKYTIANLLVRIGKQNIH
ncbi:MAG: hypothetical protein APF76_09475 [Desulfitibacter sp. BRH_c19]|nr:MAG: hypothetical protein APF76_09475 [Desulfitibacter sp. BRH_c19]